MFKKLWKDEQGLGTLELILIISVLVFAAIFFRDNINAWLGKLTKNTNQSINQFQSKKPTKVN